MKKIKLNKVYSLKFLKPILDDYELLIEEPLEVTPFTKWSSNFAACYWYTKYLLTMDLAVILNRDLEEFLDEENLNFTWLTITDNENFKLECRDGNFEIQLLSNNKRLETLFEKVIEDCR